MQKCNKQEQEIRGGDHNAFSLRKQNVAKRLTKQYCDIETKKKQILLTQKNKQKLIRGLERKVQFTQKQKKY